MDWKIWLLVAILVVIGLLLQRSDRRRFTKTLRRFARNEMEQNGDLQCLNVKSGNILFFPKLEASFGEWGVLVSAQPNSGASGDAGSGEAFTFVQFSSSNSESIEAPWRSQDLNTLTKATQLVTKSEGKDPQRLQDSLERLVGIKGNTKATLQRRIGSYRLLIHEVVDDENKIARMKDLLLNLVRSE